MRTYLTLIAMTLIMGYGIYDVMTEDARAMEKCMQPHGGLRYSEDSCRSMIRGL